MLDPLAVATEPTIEPGDALLRLQALAHKLNDDTANTPSYDHASWAATADQIDRDTFLVLAALEAAQL